MGEKSEFDGLVGSLFADEDVPAAQTLGQLQQEVGQGEQAEGNGQAGHRAQTLHEAVSTEANKKDDGASENVDGFGDVEPHDELSLFNVVYRE